jgi:two-component system cell cycle response regulator DivK
MKRILIVEDNDKNLKLLRDVLQAGGYGTIEAMSAGDGIALAIGERPDLILMDIQLPDMNGVAALQRLRAEAATAAIPVLAVTASVMQNERNSIVAAGFDGFLGKPFALRELLDLVRSTLEARAP